MNGIAVSLRGMSEKPIRVCICKTKIYSGRMERPISIAFFRIRSSKVSTAKSSVAELASIAEER